MAHGYTPRGFAIYDVFAHQDYSESAPEEFSVQESSLATERRVWVGRGDTRAHLTEEEAARVALALIEFLGGVWSDPWPYLSKNDGGCWRNIEGGVGDYETPDGTVFENTAVVARIVWAPRTFVVYEEVVRRRLAAAYRQGWDEPVYANPWQATSAEAPAEGRADG